MEKVFEKIDPAFSLFDLPVSWDLDLSSLQQKYRQLILKHHPDQFDPTCRWTQTLASKHTAAIHRAYRHLVDPLKRAELLFDINGIKVQTEQMSTTSLQPIWQWSERLEASEATEFKQHWSAFKQEAATTWDRFGRAMRHADWESAVDNYCMLKGFYKIIHRYARGLHEYEPNGKAAA